MENVKKDLINCLRLGKITPARQKQVAQKFFRALGRGCTWGNIQKYDGNKSIDARLIACACCGIREFENIDNPERTFEYVPLSKLAYLRLNKHEEEEFKKQRAIKCILPINDNGDKDIFYPWHARSIYPQRDIDNDEYYYYLHPELVDHKVDKNGTDAQYAEICSECLRSINICETPHNSIKSGVDFGSSARINLETPSLREQHILAFVRHYSNIIKIESNTRRLKDHCQSAIKGSSILFDQDAPMDNNLIDRSIDRSSAAIFFQIAKSGTLKNKII